MKFKKWSTHSHMSGGTETINHFDTEKEADEFIRKVLTDNPEHHPVTSYVTKYEWFERENGISCSYNNLGTWCRMTSNKNK